MINRLKDEGGYSLVEVVVSIMILAIAIIPMVAMFDTGLNTAVLGSNYDKGRALAKKQLEQVQTLPYNIVRSNFPNAPCTFDGNGLCESVDRTDPDSEFASFRYTIRKQYVQPNNDAAPSSFNNSSTQTAFMRITVQVGWGGASFDDNTYTTSGLKSR